jgi:hypothetical protein
MTRTVGAGSSQRRSGVPPGATVGRNAGIGVEDEHPSVAMTMARITIAGSTRMRTRVFQAVPSLAAAKRRVGVRGGRRRKVCAAFGGTMAL